MRRPPPGRERRIHVGALWLQLQALLALGMTAVALQRGRTHPGDGVFVLLTAPILWWLGHALGRNSRRVAIGLAVALGLFAFSLVAPVGRTGGKLLFALLQFLFLAPALHAVITSRDPRDPAWHRDYRGEVLLPVAAGVCLGLVLPRSPQRIDSAGGLYIMLLTLALVATLGVLLVRGRLRERVASAVPGLVPKLPQPPHTADVFACASPPNSSLHS